MILLDLAAKPAPVATGRNAWPMARRVPVESMSLTLKDRDATAVLKTYDLTGIQINSWLMDDTEPGKGIVWRVRSIEEGYGNRTHTVNLEHAINLLRDRIIWNEVTPADMINAVEKPKKTSEAKTCSALTAITYVMGGQVDWLLDTTGWEYGNVTGAYNFDGDDLYTALETISDTLEDCEWLMDCSLYPFTLKIRRKLAGEACEVRAGRNLRTITKTVDRGGMYTRIFPVGKDDLQLGNGTREQAYVEDVSRPANVATYGVIEKTETNSSLDEDTTLHDWAMNRLHYNNEPTVTISVEAFELSKATDEPMDHFVLGRLCRVPLPEYGGEIITARITEINFPDKKGQPEVCKLTLSNSQTDVTTLIAEAIKSTSSGARTATRTSKALSEVRLIVLDTVKQVKVTGPVNNIYTLKYLLVRGDKDKEDDWKSGGTFSRAVWEWDVSAAGGTITVTAKPQDQSKEVGVQGGDQSRKGNIYTVQIQYSAERDLSGEWKNWKDTGGKVTVDATERYEQGQKDVTLTGAWSGDNKGDKATYTVTKTPFPKTKSSWVQLKINKDAAWVVDPDGTVRARLDNSWGTVTLNGSWSGDNTGDTATYTVTAASPHSASNSSWVQLKINKNAAWVIDPDGTIRARLDNSWGTVQLVGSWSGDNTGDVATLTVSALSPHTESYSSNVTLKINKNAAWVIDPAGTIRARLDNSWGTVQLVGSWSGDNTGDVATLTVTALNPHTESYTSNVTLKINKNAAWVIDPAGTIRARLDNDWGTVTLSGAWSGDNTGDEATYTVTAASPHTASNNSKVKLHINRNAAWVTDPAGTIRARLDNNWGTVTLSGAWSGDNQGDEATYTVTAASPHTASDSSTAKLHINSNAAWITDPGGTIRARVANPMASETRITMTRGAYDPQSQTYTCTCIVNAQIATDSTFYLYHRN